MRFASSRFGRPCGARTRGPGQSGGRGRGLAAGCLLLLIAAAGRPAAAATAGGDLYPAPPGTRLVLAGTGVTDPIGALERHGFRVAVAVPPHLYYVIEHRGVALLPGGFRFAGPEAQTSASAPGSGVGAAPGDGAVLGVGAEPPADPFQGRVDALPPLPAPAPRRSLAAASLLGETPGLYHGTRWGDTSEFMIGRVAVGLLFPESDGSLDSSAFDWTPALRDSLIRSAIRGLSRWATRAAGRGIPLTFLLEIHPSLATRYEPINREVADEALWISDVLGPLVGYSGDAAGEAYQFANELRARLGAQWAYIIFGVQNGTVPPDSVYLKSVRTFPDGYIAHSRLGGPWVVMPVSEPQGALGYYIEHETTHMFWALDEYAAAGPGGGWWSCTLLTGYFAYPNTNSEIPYPGWCWGGCDACPYRCIMLGNYPGQVCPYTEGQVGWVDADADGKLDLFETRPGVTPDSIRFHAVAGQVKTMGGLAQETAIPNRNPYRYGAGDSISVARIDSVQVRVAGGPWASVPPLDGRYDTGQEPFQSDVGPLPVGNYLVEWRAWNSNGLATATPASAVLEVSASGLAAGVGGSGATAPPSLRAGPNPGPGPFRFTLTARPGASGVAELLAVSGRLVWSSRVLVPASGRLDGVCAADARGGRPPASGLYFLRVEVDGVRLTRRLVLLR